MKVWCQCLAVAAAGVLSATAVADENLERGPYFGAESVWARHAVRKDEIDRNYNVENPAATQIDNKAFGYAVYGGYRFFRYLSVDAGLFDFGRPAVHIGYHTVPRCTFANGTSTCSPVRMPPEEIETSRVDGARVRANGSLPLNDRWSIDARVGLATGSASDSPSINAIYGLGVNTQLVDAVFVRLFWDHLQGEGERSGTDVLSLGFAYQF